MAEHPPKYGSPEYVISSITDWISNHGGENSSTLLLYEAMQCIKSLIATHPNGATIADYEEVQAGHQRLVRELDVLLNGEEGAAPQASLGDIVSQVRREGIHARPTNSDFQAALCELVRLKRIKDMMSNHQTIQIEDIQHYNRSKPQAWKRAFDLVDALPWHDPLDFTAGAKSSPKAAPSEIGIGTLAQQLIAAAKDAGQVVRIDLVPRQPLEMGNLEMVAEVRPARTRAKDVAPC